jgi:SAM-dependent methyltransferase
LNLVSVVKDVRRLLLNRRSKHRVLCARWVTDKVGLEIGGPSGVFGDTGMLPIYRYVKHLDNCVFSSDTMWEGHRPAGQVFTFHPGKANGFNFIREAGDLRGIPDKHYDFVLASHSLEHSANPLKVLAECKRIAQPDGAMIVVLPHFRHTFDHRRQPTPLAHMLEDYERGTDESDLTHLPEILALHDLSRDKPAGTKEQFRERCLRNSENRGLHHHVFDEHNGPELIRTAGYQVAAVEFVKPFHLVILARLAND